MPRRAAVLIGLAIVLVTGAVNLQLPLYGLIAEEAGIGSGALSAVLAGYVAALLPTLILFGGVSDRVGRRATVLAALVCALAASLGTWWGPALESLAVARWLQGIGVALVMGAGTAWLAELPGSSSDRAAGITALASAAGFGLGALATAAWRTMDPARPPGAYLAWALLTGVALVGVWGLRDAVPKVAGPLVRRPSFPAGSAPALLGIALGWSVAGIVVAVVPLTLRTLGADAWAGPTLATMLGAGVLAQVHARRLTAVGAMRVGAGVLPLGTATVALAAWLGSPAGMVAGIAVVGTASHGYGYVGGLAHVSGLPGSRTRAVSGYFVAAYLGFGFPAVGMGFLVDALGAASAWGVLAAVMAVGCVGWWVLLARLRAPQDPTGALTPGESPAPPARPSSPPPP
ncbi:MAG: hypothetical protein ACI8PZ_001361 [Myxococcota bacterium]|jgi:hypothetical protein